MGLREDTPKNKANKLALMGRKVEIKNSSIPLVTKKKQIHFYTFDSTSTLSACGSSRSTAVISSAMAKHQFNSFIDLLSVYVVILTTIRTYFTFDCCYLQVG